MIDFKRILRSFLTLTLKIRTMFVQYDLVLNLADDSRLIT